MLDPVDPWRKKVQLKSGLSGHTSHLIHMYETHYINLKYLIGIDILAWKRAVHVRSLPRRLLISIVKVKKNRVKSYCLM